MRRRRHSSCHSLPLGATGLHRPAPVAAATGSGPMTVHPEAGADVAGRDHLGQGDGVAQ